MPESNWLSGVRPRHVVLSRFRCGRSESRRRKLLRVTLHAHRSPTAPTGQWMKGIGGTKRARNVTGQVTHQSPTGRSDIEVQAQGGELPTVPSPDTPTGLKEPGYSPPAKSHHYPGVGRCRRSGPVGQPSPAPASPGTVSPVRHAAGTRQPPSSPWRWVPRPPGSRRFVAHESSGVLFTGRIAGTQGRP
jgi:hypothetical protein